MSSALIVCCDIDGVLADIEPEMERRILKHFGKETVQITSREFYLEDRYGIDKKEMRAFKDSPGLFQDPEFWMQAQPFRQNIDTLQKWHRNYNAKQVFLLTGRHNSQREATERWLDLYNIRYDALFMGCLQHKAEVMDYLDADFIIEDRFEEAWTVAKKKRTAYIIERGYNVHHKEKLLQGRYLDNIHWIKSFINIELREGFRNA